MKNVWLDIANGPSRNSDGTVGPMIYDVMGSCVKCHTGIRSWFHGQGMICGQCIHAILDDFSEDGCAETCQKCGKKVKGTRV